MVTSALVHQRGCAPGGGVTCCHAVFEFAIPIVDTLVVQDATPVRLCDVNVISHCSCQGADDTCMGRPSVSSQI